ncbi:MAG: nucleotide exchange factor GrpE [Hyphomonadaceae bacterium]|nr:nucleotide exchange factor GrpE [Hyphomonadaceae bacterium]
MNEDVETQPEEASTIDAAAPPPSAEERIAKLEALLAQAHDERLRALAEAENTRRRAEKQVADSRTFAIDRFARDLLPVADTLARALAAAPAEARAGEGVLRAFFDGVEMTERTLLEAFQRHGLKRIGVKGEAFDPNLHQAVAQIPADAPAGAVAEVFQPGFALAERTLRPAMVAVSAGAPAPEPAAPPPSEAGAGIDIKV